PDDIHDEAAFIANSPDTVFQVKVDVVEMLGAETLLYCTLNQEESDTTAEGGIKSLTDDTTNLIARVDGRTKTQRGQVIDLAIDINRVHMFDKETEMTLLKR
ncbi:MAG: hypothetical protein II368_00990, partial [Clostridia bacterium]|nr:hypothetical protein [Clostridia bacterium]